METLPRSPFDDAIGLTFTEVSGDRVVATWKAEARHHQPFGLVHGGVYATIVESLGSIGASVWFGDRGTCVGVNNNTDFFRGVSEGHMVSTATPLHRGRSQQLWVVETRDSDDRLVARGQLRVQNLSR